MVHLNIHFYEFGRNSFHRIFAKDKAETLALKESLTISELYTKSEKKVYEQDSKRKKDVRERKGGVRTII